MIRRAFIFVFSVNFLSEGGRTGHSEVGAETVDGQRAAHVIDLKTDREHDFCGKKLHLGSEQQCVRFQWPLELRLEP